MERQGSGFKKITDAYHAAHNFRTELEPVFYSDVTSFQVTLYNLNYEAETDSGKAAAENAAIDVDHVAIEAVSGYGKGKYKFVNRQENDI